MLIILSIPSDAEFRVRESACLIILAVKEEHLWKICKLFCYRIARRMPAKFHIQIDCKIYSLEVVINQVRTIFSMSNILYIEILFTDQNRSKISFMYILIHNVVSSYREREYNCVNDKVLYQ